MLPDGSLRPHYLEELAAFLSAPQPRQLLDTTLGRYRTQERPLVELAPGLTAAELRAAEEAFGVALPPDFRSLLGAFVPIGERWANWRDPEAELAHMHDWVRKAADFDVRHCEYWHPTWGEQPADAEEATAAAEESLKNAPPLLRIYAHRFLPALPGEAGNPVISMYQFVDSIYYGSDLADYFHNEFGAPRPDWARDEPREVPFWSSIID